MTAAGTRIVYFGTPEVAIAPLRALHDAGHEVVLVVSRPPRRRGRREPPTPSPVADAAAALGLDVTSDPRDAVAADADLGVVVAYGEHIADEVLRQRRTVNLHFSLLPRWRGAAPVEWAILAGDHETGVCLMDVASEIDVGDVYRRASTPIGAHETADELRARLCEMGVEMLLEALAEGFGQPQPQSGPTTWADKITPSDLRIDWSAPAEQVMRQVRVGGAWTTFRGKRLKILEARPILGARPMAPSMSGPRGATLVGCDNRPSDGEAGRTGVDRPQRPPAAATGRAVSRSVAGRADAAEPGMILASASADFPEAVMVAAGDTPLELLTVQAEGRKGAAARDWRNGARPVAGERFGR